MAKNWRRTPFRFTSQKSTEREKQCDGGRGDSVSPRGLEGRGQHVAVSSEVSDEFSQQIALLFPFSGAQNILIHGLDLISFSRSSSSPKSPHDPRPQWSFQDYLEHNMMALSVWVFLFFFILCDFSSQLSYKHLKGCYHILYFSVLPTEPSRVTCSHILLTDFWMRV